MPTTYTDSLTVLWRVNKSFVFQGQVLKSPWRDDPWGHTLLRLILWLENVQPRKQYRFWFQKVGVAVTNTENFVSDFWNWIAGAEKNLKVPDSKKILNCPELNIGRNTNIKGTSDEDSAFIGNWKKGDHCYTVAETWTVTYSWMENRSCKWWT